MKLFAGFSQRSDKLRDVSLGLGERLASIDYIRCALSLLFIGHLKLKNVLEFFNCHPGTRKNSLALDGSGS